MARKARPVEYDLTDDFDGKVLPDGTESTKFTLGAVRYEIDLSATNAKKLTDALAKVAEFTDKARASGGSAPARRGRPAGSSNRRSGGPSLFSQRDKDEQAAIRAFGVKAGTLKGDRGRVPDAVVEAFDAQK